MGYFFIRIKNIIVNWLYLLLTFECPNCKTGRVQHRYIDGNLNIYECDTCGNEYCGL